MITRRSATLFATAAASLAFAPAAFALPAAKHVPAPHVCDSAPVRGGVGSDGHQHQTGQGHQSHGNGWGYGHGCGATDGGGNGGGGNDGGGDWIG